MLRVLLVLLGCCSRGDIAAPSFGIYRDPPTSADDGAFNPTAGCADGHREGFVDVATYPNIAGCSGGWTIPGVMLANPGHGPACLAVETRDTTSPACGRAAGDDGLNPTGRGCNVADLCSEGWHVCATAQEVATHSPTGCAGAAGEQDPPLFFVSRQSSNGCGHCATGSRVGPDCNSVTCSEGCAQTAATSNDVFGCGNIGANSGLGCEPLDRFSQNRGSALAGTSWRFDADISGYCEAYAVVHAGPGYGGALCCRD